MRTIFTRKSFEEAGCIYTVPIDIIEKMIMSILHDNAGFTPDMGFSEYCGFIYGDERIFSISFVNPDGEEAEFSITRNETVYKREGHQYDVTDIATAQYICYMAFAAYNNLL